MKKLGLYLVFLLGIGVFVMSLWQTRDALEKQVFAFERIPEGIMGTSCRMIVVLEANDAELAKKVLDRSEFLLRYIESKTSNWIEASEISQFNQAEIGAFALSNSNWDVMRAAKDAFEATHGAFDITCSPLLDVWKDAGKLNLLPEGHDISSARTLSSWDMLEFDEDERSVIKKSPSLHVALGGIAKGYAIDQALESLEQTGVAGGMVDVGGDIRFFGKSNAPSGSWEIETQDPNDPSKTMNAFALSESWAVCTSGNYARFVEIEGKRYSHIVDPVSGYPAEVSPSVTVLAHTAMEADIWATAISVLGAEGFELLPMGVEVSILQKDPQDGSMHVVSTSGFPVSEE